MLLGSLILASEQVGPQANTLASRQSSATRQGVHENADSENPCVQFDKLNTLVRDRLIDREMARMRIKELLPRLKAYFYAKGGTDSPKNDWVFPVQGYNQKSIGGVRGNGYVARGYDYFDGNKHLGHPAHDIFIKDENQDGLDDNTHEPVNVLAMKSGVVVATANEWSAGSDDLPACVSATGMRWASAKCVNVALAPE